MVKVLLDTNILIDFALRREPYFKQARKVMILGYLREIELWMGCLLYTSSPISLFNDFVNISCLFL